MKTNSKTEKQLSLSQLDQRMKSLAGQERELLCEVLQTIQEIHRRRMYLEFGFANLFSYLVDGVGYSDGSAQRRIEAARLITEIPETLAVLKSGELKLTQVSLIQQAAREKTKTSATPVTTQDKKEILKLISHKNFGQSQQQVAAYFDLPIKQQTKLKVQADESVRFEISVPKKLYEEMKQAQALISHAVPDPSWVAYLEYVTHAIIKQKTNVRTTKAAGVKNVKKFETNLKTEIAPGGEMGSKQISAINQTAPPNDPAAAIAKNSTVENRASVAISTLALASEGPPATSTERPFSARQRKLLLKIENVCQFRDPMTLIQCGSRWFLQIDHKHSRWAGGPSTLENAQVLCGRHNRHKYAKEAARGHSLR